MIIFARSAFLFLWLFAIAAPSVITFIDSDNTFLITSLNEEEQQEQGKKNLEEEKIIGNDLSLILLSFNYKERLAADVYLFGNSIHTQKILLPPPESII